MEIRNSNDSNDLEKRTMKAINGVPDAVVTPSGGRLQAACSNSLEREFHEEPSDAALERRGRPGPHGIRAAVGLAFLGSNRLNWWARDCDQPNV